MHGTHCTDDTDADYTTTHKQNAKSTHSSSFSSFFPLLEILQLAETKEIKKTGDLRSMLSKRLYYTSKHLKRASFTKSNIFILRSRIFYTDSPLSGNERTVVIL